MLALSPVYLDWRDFDTTINDLMLMQNGMMDSFTIRLQTVNGSIRIFVNSPSMAADTTKLQEANNVTIQNVSKFNTPSLTKLNGYFDISSTSMTNCTAPLMYTLGDMVGGNLMIQNNSALSGITQFPSLAGVDKNLTVEGPVDTLVMPGLGTVGGLFLLNPSLDVSCSQWAAVDKANVGYRGDFVCYSEGKLWVDPPSVSNTTSTASATTSETSSTTASGSSSPSATPTNESATPENNSRSIGAKIGIGFGSVFGAIAICSLVYAFCWPKNRAQMQEQTGDKSRETAEEDGNEVYPPAMLGNNGERFELVLPVNELPLGHKAPEMEAKHRRADLPGCPAFEVPRGIVSADGTEGQREWTAGTNEDQRTDANEMMRAAKTPIDGGRSPGEVEDQEKRADQNIKQEQ